MCETNNKLTGILEEDEAVAPPSKRNRKGKLYVCFAAVPLVMSFVSYIIPRRMYIFWNIGNDHNIHILLRETSTSGVLG